MVLGNKQIVSGYNVYWQNGLKSHSVLYIVRKGKVFGFRVSVIGVT